MKDKGRQETRKSTGGEYDQNALGTNWLEWLIALDALAEDLNLVLSTLFLSYKHP